MVKCAFLAVLLTTSGISIANAETLAQTEPLSVPAGTVLHCRTNETLTTKLNSQGDAFTINIAEPVTTNGRVTIPAGTSLAGRVTSMERPGRIKGVGQMRLTLEHITLPDGRSYPLGATLMTAYGADNIKVVGGEGLIKGPRFRVPDLGRSAEEPPVARCWGLSWTSPHQRFPSALPPRPSTECVRGGRI